MNKMCATVMLMSLLLLGCSSEEPKEAPAKDTPSSTLQAAADRAQEVIDKTVSALHSLAEKATELKVAAWKAATDMAATVQNEAPAPADVHK